MREPIIAAPEGFRLDEWLNPPVEFRPAVLWSWNGEVTRARITSMLEDFAARGIGGVFIHPRPGLVTEYLSQEWFELWTFALEECRRLGILAHIYDENSFPSGFGGGHVVAANPLAANSRLAARWILNDRPETNSSPPLAILSRDSAGGTLRANPEGGPPSAASDAPRLALHMEKFPPSLWHAGFPMADVCRRDAVEGFLACTHARHAQLHRGDMGSTIRYVFTDEPETGSGPEGFHLSSHFLSEFQADHGYALEGHLGALCGDLPSSPAVRHDYHSTLNRLFTSGMGRLTHDWCESHGLRFTGHLNEHAWPFPSGAPSAMAFQRWMQTPGLDLLAFQFRPAPLKDSALWLFNAKEASSVAAQCGRGEVLCESSGGGGYAFGPSGMKPLEDFLLALGVNRFAPHLSHQTLGGVRKYDWPQTIGDHSPWFDAYAVQARHVARTAWFLSQGTESNRMLVLNPTTTGWIHYRPEAYHWPGENPHAQLEALAKTHPAFLVDLYSRQIDFDLGDECLLAELGSVEPGSLKVGCRSYGTVVVPPGMENILSSTLALLERFLGLGGTVVAAGPPPAFVDGRPRSLALGDHPNWVSAGSDAVEILRRRHAPVLSSQDGSPLPADLLWTHRALPEGGAVVFLANASNAPLRAEVAFPGASAWECDTRSGAIDPLECQPAGEGRIAFLLDLDPGTHRLFQVSSSPASTAFPKASWSTIPTRCLSEEPLEPNLLPLDYCEVSGPRGRRFSGHAIHADTENWKCQGFDRNLWRVSIQYRRTFLNARIPEDSGLTVRYRFSISPAFLASDAARELAVAVERPWLASVFCNDQPVDSTECPVWFDEEMRLLPLGGFLKAGGNTLELRYARFHVRAEIMPVILRGRFRADPVDSGFRLEPATPWAPGSDRREHGWGFYPGRSGQSHTFELASCSRLRIRLPDFQGSAIGVSIDGSAPMWEYQPGLEIEWLSPLEPGAHRLDMILCGHLLNLLGPHFHNGLPGAWSWENSPCEPVPGSAYRLLPVCHGGGPIVTGSAGLPAH